MTFSALTSGQTDADSPLDQALMDLIRTNFDDHETRITANTGTGVTNGDSHDHDGGDGATIPQGGLKTTMGAVSTSSTTPVSLTLPGGQYGFYPQIKMSDTSNEAWRASILPISATQSGWASYATSIGLQAGLSGGGDTIYAQQRYIQASPPYMLGDINWGHFLFLLRNITSGEIISSYEAEDPPWAYNGLPQFELEDIEGDIIAQITVLKEMDEYKNSSLKEQRDLIYQLMKSIIEIAKTIHKNNEARIQVVPHPFADYLGKPPAADGLEIQLIRLDDVDVRQWKKDNRLLGKGILEDINSVITNTKGAILTPAQAGIGNIPGFTDKVKIRARN